MTTLQEKEPTPSKELVHNNHNKLLEFQQRVSAISKDSVNPFFKSKYFDINTVIDTIKPILNEVGLVVTQPLAILEGRNVLRTEIYDGMNLILFSSVLLPDIADVQKFGAAITYFRRYALVSLLLLQGEEDDDGNRAVKRAPTKVITPEVAELSHKFNQVVKTPTTNGKEFIESEEKIEGAIRATPKQVSFIKTLIKKKGQSDKTTDEKINNLSIGQAKTWIDKLIKMPDDEIIEMDQPEIPYIPGKEND